MRKILLATTALVGFAVTGAAQAATSSPLNVTVGGDVDFVAAQSAASNKGDGNSSSNRNAESLYDLVFNVTGKANNGIEYGGTLGLTNAPDINNFFEGTNATYMSAANIWMSGAFGKVVLGDSHGATDLVVGTPTVGEGQTSGRYIDFLDTRTFAKTFVVGVDGTDHSTNFTYFTPKVGNDSNKLQLGFTYEPHMYDYGSNEVQYNSGVVNGSNALSAYHDVLKGAVNYTGTIAPVAVKASAHIINGTSDVTTPSNDLWTLNAPTAPVKDFTAYGIGAQGSLDGFTLGLNYTDMGRYNTVMGQNKSQDTYGAGLKYEFDKYGLGVNYLGGEGYDNMLYTGTGGGTNVTTTNYVRDFNSYGLGGSYAWAPGLTSGVDGVYFDQRSTGTEDKGYVLLVSQKLSF